MSDRNKRLRKPHTALFFFAVFQNVSCEKATSIADTTTKRPIIASEETSGFTVTSTTMETSDTIKNHSRTRDVLRVHNTYAREASCTIRLFLTAGIGINLYDLSVHVVHTCLEQKMPAKL